MCFLFIFFLAMSALDGLREKLLEYKLAQYVPGLDITLIGIIETSFTTVHTASSIKSVVGKVKMICVDGKLTGYEAKIEDVDSFPYFTFKLHIPSDCCDSLLIFQAGTDPVFGNVVRISNIYSLCIFIIPNRRSEPIALPSYWVDPYHTTLWNPSDNLFTAMYSFRFVMDESCAFKARAVQFTFFNPEVGAYQTILEYVDIFPFDPIKVGHDTFLFRRYDCRAVKYVNMFSINIYNGKVKYF